MSEVEMTTCDKLVFYVNGKKVEETNLDPKWTLLQYLRSKLRLPGTKLGCSEGGCGACTVMVSKLDRQSGKIRHFTVNACLAPVATMHGLSVTTTEGIGSTHTRIHPVQERLARAHGSQCGFCTPGFVMSMYTLLRNNPLPTTEEVEDSIVGNLCRCTGYRPIIEGFRTFTAEAANAKAYSNGCGKKNCCMLKKQQEIAEEKISENSKLLNTSVLFDPSMFTPYDPSQEIIFPPELKMNKEIDMQSLRFAGPDCCFYRPTSLADLLSLKNTFPEAKIIVGNTEVGIETKFKKQNYPVLVYPTSVDELTQFRCGPDGVVVGAALTLSQVQAKCEEVIKALPKYKTRVLQAIVEMLRWFAGQQIRNVAALGGNIMTGSPISDLNPILMAAGAKLTFQSRDHVSEITFDDNFYIGYRRNIAKTNEVLISINIPFTQKDEYFAAFKQSKRRDDDIAIVNAAMRAHMRPRSTIVERASLVFGGMAATTVTAAETAKNLEGKEWNNALLEFATVSLLKEMQLDFSAPGGMVEYRKALTASFFFKFYLTVCREIHLQHPEFCSTPLSAEEDKITQPYTNLRLKSTQFYQNVPPGQDKIDPVGRPLQHVSSLKHACGEATFIDDMPRRENELSAALVVSSRAYAKIISIDTERALALPSVHAVFTAKDIPGSNRLLSDEEFLASEKVYCVGQPIAILVADDHESAIRAVDLVSVSYENIPNPIFTIEGALAASSTWSPFIIESGDPDGAMKECEVVVEGESYMSGQEHFYLETNVHLAIPKEGNEMELISSTQNVNDSQIFAASCLGVPRNRVTCKVVRIGGGFGGKETRTIMFAGPVTLAAHKLRRPVRLLIERDTDMLLTGGRHPFMGRWKVGCSRAGLITAADVQLYANAGHSLDLSSAVIFRAVFSAENAYKIENIRLKGVPCRTNLPSNTAFRGFGTPQGCFVIEDMIHKVSEIINVNSKLVRELNFYNSGDATPCGQKLIDCHVWKCWDQLLESFDCTNKENQIKSFNKNHKYRKRGLSLIPSKFPLSFGKLDMNQSGCLILVYTDGSVLLSHGGMEMGQGVHTKMLQVAAKALNVPIENIYIAETSTDKVPNTSPSAASATSDLNGGAILNACDKILKRLEPFKQKLPKGEWKDWVQAAYDNFVSLSATGFFSPPGLTPMDLKTKKGNPFTYYVYGAAASIVEIDCLTGDHTVLRTDIVMDVGTSLNPAIDIGQIEGAFVQGLGLFTIEKLFFSPQGALLTTGPGAYKIPSVNDIPKEFNVSFLRDSSNPRAVFSSKSVGEPPFFSAASVFFAIREAVKAAQGHKSGSPFHFVSPATVESIRMACTDNITQQIECSKKGTFVPWALDI